MVLNGDYPRRHARIPWCHSSFSYEAASSRFHWLSKPIATPAKDDEQKPPKRKPKDLEDVKKKLNLKGESKADEKERAPVDPIAWVVDPVNGTKCRKAVAQSAMMTPPKPLNEHTHQEGHVPETLIMWCVIVGLPLAGRVAQKIRPCAGNESGICPPK